MDNKYNLYVDLLLRKDKYLKEAYGYSNEFIKLFGTKIINNYTMQIECTRLKKQVEYCQKKANYHDVANRSELLSYLKVVCFPYEVILRRMKKEYQDAKNYEAISDDEYKLIEEKYKFIAPKIHPDIYCNNPKASELYDRLYQAYKANDLKEMEKLETIIDCYINAKGLKECEVDNIDWKIKKVQNEIEKIITTDPYCFKEILEDEHEIGKKIKELNDSSDNIGEYIEELKTVCHSYKINNKLS